MTSAPTPSPGAAEFSLRRRPASEKLLDQGFHYLTLALASFVGILLLAIVLTVFHGAREAIATFGARFITTSSWDPVNNEYGAFVAIYGTLVTSLLSLVIAVPLGIGTAIFITEDLIPTRLRNLIGLMVELLAAIPSVVLGLWAIFVMEPAIRPALNLVHTLFWWSPFFAGDPADHHGHQPRCPEPGTDRVAPGGLRDRHHPLGRLDEHHSASCCFGHHRRRHARPGAGHG
jgi:phosphate transport system permease protein